METLKYLIEDSTIADLLGRQNFSNQYSPILELVKNAYDALSPEIIISFEKNRIIIQDFGIGMSMDEIKTKWMHVGASEKYAKYDVEDVCGRRVLSGSKGVGRFALARLGNQVVIKSKKEQNDGVIWKTDWSKSEIGTYSLDSRGTTMEIVNLRDKWSNTEINILADYLSKTIFDDKLKILIKYDGKEILVKSYFYNKEIKSSQYQAIIDFEYGKKIKEINETKFLSDLIVKVHNDEFESKASAFSDGININYFEKEINCFDELRSMFSSYDDKEFQALLKQLGCFSGKLYFSHSVSKTDADRFCYKTEKSDFLDNGVILYRNAFSLSSFEGNKDWLQFGKRSRLSPAAATHPTGSWRVRENQIAGYVLIDRKENGNIKEMANRQGIEETPIYFLFVNIIQIAIAEYERYRQSIMRKINAKMNMHEENKPKPKVLSLLNKNPSKLKDLTENETKTLLKEIKETQEDSKKAKRDAIDTQNKYRYDVRILNVLATSGLKAASIAHELKNDTEFLEASIDFIIDELKEINMWKTIEELTNQNDSYENVPYLLNRNKQVNFKTIGFIDSMLSGVTKSQFITKKMNVVDEINKIIVFWKEQYSLLSFDIRIASDLTINMSPDILKVIFDNLILNSVQQNANKHLTIQISIEIDNSKIHIIYKDFGVGLPNKYINDPYRILEVHETSRVDGHGLGMWIVHNSILSTNGGIVSIDGHSGFTFEFILGKEE